MAYRGLSRVQAEQRTAERVARAQARIVAAAARDIIAASTIGHSPGGRVPGAEQALTRAAEQQTAAEQRAITEQAPGVPSAGLDVA
jgi:hypothetical protein